jgi:hypothetical protein
MNDNFYFDTDKNKYIPIKTDFDIIHSNRINTTGKSDNKIGLIYSTDLKKHVFKDIPKHMNIINSTNSSKDNESKGESEGESESESESESNLNPINYSSYYSTNYSESGSENKSKVSESGSENKSKVSESGSENKSKVSESGSGSDSENPFKQQKGLDIDLLNDVNNSLIMLNNQVISLCNKKKGLSGIYRHLFENKIKKILNQCL